ncbi:SIMPL domain-containing protein [Candidatus Falkowbacteria bacterium]|nr:SIMPL domain-containing protein [Candidatus Falkowbacteria bacterium]
MEGETTLKIKPPKAGVVFVVIALIFLSALFAVLIRNQWKTFDYIGKSAEMTNQISITGEGTVAAAPDIAKIQVGVTSEAKTVAGAQNDNTKKMNEVVKAIKAQSVAEKDLKTENYNIYPKYEWKTGKSEIIGYVVTQSLSVKVRDTKNISGILKAATDKGANQVGDLKFSVDEPERLKVEAREKAIKNAKQKAEMLANQLGVKLGKIVSFYEAEGGLSDYPKFSTAEGMGGGGEMPTVQAGENEIKIVVTIVYEIL